MAARKRRPTKQEVEFLAKYDASVFAKPSVAVDIVLLTVVDDKLQAFAIKRREHPDRGLWGLPGGFVKIDESLDRCAQRILTEKTGLRRQFLEQLYTFGEPDRDPRTRIITVTYYALVPPERLRGVETDEAKLMNVKVPWKGETGGLAWLQDTSGKDSPLAFDHETILGLAVQRLRGKLAYAPIGFELLPRQFTLRQLQLIHETILDRSLNKDSFRRKMLASGMVIATGQREADVGHRPAELYRFSRKPA